MHQVSETINPPVFSSHALSYHQSAAMYAANMIRFQYTKEAKAKCRRECLEHLKASLAHDKEGAA
ncbi:hypothetical protein [Pseudomonas sp. FW300-N2A2]|jgi:hypothetical protein|uniref:hypothetical protein n=1 Tax=Pseudomonas sp. FW300-N2A2 TaxID=2751316 RepID=UPI001A932270|nr:hypothetical protein [Pseudomonas sp. FW300-N2A2]